MFSSISCRKFTCQRDNLTIAGKEYLPKNHNEKMPAVIVSHAFMANMNMFKKYAKAFAEKGYAAFAYDFNGGGLGSKSTGKTTDMSVLTEKADLKAVLSYVSSLPYVDSENITLLGCSQGGFVSALLAAELKTAIKNLILFYPALCIPDDARKGNMLLSTFDPKNLPDVIKCGPMKLGRCYPEAVMNMDAFAEISPYEGPVLIVHGTEDNVVNIDYAKKAVETYKNASLVIIEGANHGFSGKNDTIALDAVWKFISQ